MRKNLIIVLFFCKQSSMANNTRLWRIVIFVRCRNKQIAVIAGIHVLLHWRDPQLNIDTNSQVYYSYVCSLRRIQAEWPLS